MSTIQKTFDLEVQNFQVRFNDEGTPYVSNVQLQIIDPNESDPANGNIHKHSQIELSEEAQAAIAVVIADLSDKL